MFGGIRKKEICAIIEKMRPTSLWERHFEKFGSQESWMKKIVEVHSTRNKVAHQKTISVEEFTTINRKINSVNRNLTNTIEGIREENFTEYGVVDILGSFATIAVNLVKNIVEPQAFKDVVIGFNAKVQEMLKPMIAVYKSGMVDDLNFVGKAYANMNLEITQSEMIKSMNAMAESFSVSKAVVNSLSATKSLAGSFAATKAIADSFASPKALTQSFATSQMLAESAKTTEMLQKSFAIPKWGHISPTASLEDEEYMEKFDEKEVEGNEEE